MFTLTVGKRSKKHRMKSHTWTENLRMILLQRLPSKAISDQTVSRCNYFLFNFVATSVQIIEKLSTEYCANSRGKTEELMLTLEQPLPKSPIPDQLILTVIFLYFRFICEPVITLTVEKRSTMRMHETLCDASYYVCLLSA